uniref:Uncharacterized protein n=1 Tax=Molossus molossus TaxID=27622 RepID=A0A7J8I9Z1_MOLMO|nr:hypothetical protein HJG59_010616 [Molossus molossus]
MEQIFPEPLLCAKHHGFAEIRCDTVPALKPLTAIGQNTKCSDMQVLQRLDQGTEELVTTGAFLLFLAQPTPAIASRACCSFCEDHSTPNHHKRLCSNVTLPAAF